MSEIMRTPAQLLEDMRNNPPEGHGAFSPIEISFARGVNYSIAEKISRDRLLTRQWQLKLLGKAVSAGCGNDWLAAHRLWGLDTRRWTDELVNRRAATKHLAQTEEDRLIEKRRKGKCIKEK